MKRKLTLTQRTFLQRFASGELNATSRGAASDAAICRNLTARGLLGTDGTLTDAGRAALASGFYQT